MATICYLTSTPVIVNPEEKLIIALNRSEMAQFMSEIYAASDGEDFLSNLYSLLDIAIQFDSGSDLTQ